MPIVDHSRTMPPGSLGDVQATVRALVQVMEAYGPVLTHRAALRCQVGERLVRQANRSSSLPNSDLVAVLALAEIDLVASGSAHLELPWNSTRAALSANTLAPLPGLATAAGAIRDIGERWDGSGSPDQITGASIALAARVFAVADALVGNPALGFLPSWDMTQAGLGHAEGRLDPELVRAGASVDLGSIALPSDRVETIMQYFDCSPGPASTVAAFASPRPGRGVEPHRHPVLTTVLHASEPDRLLGLIADSIMVEFGAFAVSFVELSPSGTDLTSIAQRGDHAASEDFVSELSEFSAITELSAGAMQHGAHRVALPIRRHGSPWGALLVIGPPDQPSLDQTAVADLARICEEVAHTISVSEEWARLERMATRDQLTGLANRHELNQAIDAIFARPPTDRLDSAVIMCDVDGLKVINDTHGHDAGDQLLIDAATALRAASRDPHTTTICRIGGDEFCVVIDGGALLTAHEVSNAIERLFERSAGSGAARSISCGVAFADLEMTSRSDLLKAADENQYLVKRERRRARGEPIEDQRRGDRRARR